jgi:hypothetical protein
MKKILLWTFGIVGVLFLAIQIVPFGRAHANPPVTLDAPWDSPETRALAVRACYDCHSNESVWPWYANVAPASWLIQHDVDEGRSKLNFSEWDKRQREAHEAAESVEDGSMPRWFYIPLHPAANLNTDEKQQLIQGLQAIGGRE